MSILHHWDESDGVTSGDNWKTCMDGVVSI